MKIIQVNNIANAAEEASKIFKDEINLSSVCLTGGRFGVEFLKNLSKTDINISKLEIFQTDERILCSKDEVIQFEFNKYLSSIEGFDASNLNFFSYREQSDSNLQKIKQKVNLLKAKCFDLCYLSLGEDGHLAGHFNNSLHFDDMFCLTKDAPKVPKNRVSFKLQWLMNSKKIILACIGKDKQRELNKLLQGEGLHSNILDVEVTLITDLEISSLNNS